MTKKKKKKNPTGFKIIGTLTINISHGEYWHWDASCRVLRHVLKDLSRLLRSEEFKLLSYILRFSHSFSARLRSVDRDVHCKTLILCFFNLLCVDPEACLDHHRLVERCVHGQVWTSWQRQPGFGLTHPELYRTRRPQNILWRRVREELAGRVKFYSRFWNWTVQLYTWRSGASVTPSPSSSQRVGEVCAHVFHSRPFDCA